MPYENMNLRPLSVGERVKVIRTALGWRQIDLAAYARAQLYEVRHCERGGPRATQDSIRRMLAALYDAGTDAGLFGDGEQLELSPLGTEEEVKA